MINDLTMAVLVDFKRQRNSKGQVKIYATDSVILIEWRRDDEEEWKLAAMFSIIFSGFTYGTYSLTGDVPVRIGG